MPPKAALAPWYRCGREDVLSTASKSNIRRSRDSHRHRSARIHPQRSVGSHRPTRLVPTRRQRRPARSSHTTPARDNDDRMTSSNVRRRNVTFRPSQHLVVGGGQGSYQGIALATATSPETGPGSGVWLAPVARIENNSLKICESPITAARLVAGLISFLSPVCFRSFGLRFLDLRGRRRAIEAERGSFSEGDA